MAMTYTEASALERNTWFVDRVRVSVSTYANYLLNTPEDDPQYAQKIGAAQRLSSQSALVVNTLMFTLSGDAEIQAAGPCIGDPQLQMIVEKTLLKLYPVPPAPVAAPPPVLNPLANERLPRRMQ
jgi:hypothetical protein